jgi:hypothetical protein
MSDTGDDHHDWEEPSNVNQTTNSAALDTAKDWFRRVLKAQHASIFHAQEDRHANCKLFLAAHQDNANCIGCLEELLLAMNLIKQKWLSTQVNPAGFRLHWLSATFVTEIHCQEQFFQTADTIGVILMCRKKELAIGAEVLSGLENGGVLGFKHPPKPVLGRVQSRGVGCLVHVGRFLLVVMIVSCVQH